MEVGRLVNGWPYGYLIRGTKLQGHGRPPPVALILWYRSYTQMNMLGEFGPQSVRLGKIACPAKSLKRPVNILLSAMAPTEDGDNQNTVGPSLSENDERL